MTTETIPIDTASYERQHGRKPHGRGYWRFKLCTQRATEKDHVVDRQTEQTNDKALADACDVARRRRSSCIMVLP